MTVLTIRNARVPRCLLVDAPGEGDFAAVDIRIEAGSIAAIAPSSPHPEPVEGSRASVQDQAGAAFDRLRMRSEETIDLDRGIVFPLFVEAHTHLDKGHIWPRRPNPDGTFMGALESVMRDREANWSATDVAARMDFALRAAEHHGVGAIRTHIDSIGDQIALSWPVFAETRARWEGRIALQATPLFGIERALDPAHMRAIVAAVKAHGSGILGAVAYMIPELDAALDIMVRTAMEEGFDLDFHVDEASDLAARALERIAAAALRHRFPGRILCGHCCSLALQEPEDERRIIGMVREAGIAVVSLPMCNMYLQDRRKGLNERGRTPRWRGVTSLHELKAAGVPVMVASDNTRDPFYAYGDLDTLEVFREGVRILQLDHPFGDWPRAVTATPADIMGMPERGRIAVGLPADLVLFRARSWTELLSRPQTDRIVMRAGERLATALPDYRELDGLVGMKP